MKARALENPQGFLQFVEEHFESQGEDNAKGAIYHLYDTARSGRFTPASWCDGELTFFV